MCAGHKKIRNHTVVEEGVPPPLAARDQRGRRRLTRLLLRRARLSFVKGSRWTPIIVLSRRGARAQQFFFTTVPDEPRGA